MKKRYFIFYFSILYVAAECNPLPLQELCRGKIRYYLRQNIWREHPDLETEKPIVPVQQRQNPQQRTLRRFVIPIFEESDEALTDDEQEIGRARFLLNARLADAHPGEAITTTLQLVRAVIQPNQNDSEENQRVLRNVSEDTRDAAMTTSFHVRQQRRKSSVKNSASSTSTDGTSGAGHSSSTVNADINDNNNEQTGERDTGKSTTAYSNMSDSDSDAEQENAFVQRKKIAKREKTDSGIVDDINFSNEDGSSSSNTNHSDSDITDTTDTGDAMDLVLPDTYNSCRTTCSSRSSKDSTSRKNATVVHFVDSNAFAAYMWEKIQQLPLPFSIKLYMNYNRKV